MLPRIRAEENIEATEAVGIGTATLQKDARKEIMGNWIRKMGATRKRKLTPEQQGAVLASIGIEVCRI